MTSTAECLTFMAAKCGLVWSTAAVGPVAQRGRICGYGGSWRARSSPAHARRDFHGSLLTRPQSSDRTTDMVLSARACEEQNGGSLEQEDKRARVVRPRGGLSQPPPPSTPPHSPAAAAAVPQG